MVVSKKKVCKSSLSSLFVLFIFLSFVSRFSIDKFSLNMLFKFSCTERIYLCVTVWADDA